jgi:hypothetical protein
VFIHGEVDDALEFVNSKSIMVVPLLSGGGMRVKIVEGMAMENASYLPRLGPRASTLRMVAISSSPITPMSFTMPCLNASPDEHYCREIGRNARKLMEQQHDVNTVTRQLADFYQSIV